jgi:hypothetical protein
MKIAVFWVVAPCSLVEVALMMEAARTSDTWVNFYPTTRCYNPEDSNLQTVAWAPVCLTSFMAVLIVQACWHGCNTPSMFNPSVCNQAMHRVWMKDEGCEWMRVRESEGEWKRNIRKPTGLLTASPSFIIHLVSSVGGLGLCSWLFKCQW